MRRSASRFAGGRNESSPGSPGPNTPFGSMPAAARASVTSRRQRARSSVAGAPDLAPRHQRASPVPAGAWAARAVRRRPSDNSRMSEAGAPAAESAAGSPAARAARRAASGAGAAAGTAAAGFFPVSGEFPPPRTTTNATSAALAAREVARRRGAVFTVEIVTVAVPECSRISVVRARRGGSARSRRRPPPRRRPLPDPRAPRP